MAHEKRREAQAWLGKAENDLRGAEVDLAAAPPLSQLQGVNAGITKQVATYLSSLQARRRRP